MVVTLRAGTTDTEELTGAAGSADSPMTVDAAEAVELLAGVPFLAMMPEETRASLAGSLTAVRYPTNAEPEQVRQAIVRHLEPASMGLAFEPVRAQALAASADWRNALNRLAERKAICNFQGQPLRFIAQEALPEGPFDAPLTRAICS